MTTVAEIIHRMRDKLVRNEGMPGNNSLIYFEGLNAQSNTYDGNAQIAQVSRVGGPWKVKIYLRMAMEFTAPTSEEALKGIEKKVGAWANSTVEPIGE